MLKYFLTAMFVFLAVPVVAETRVDGLVTINPEWHTALDQGLCLAERGAPFAPCLSELSPAGGAVDLVGPTPGQSHLMTRYAIYAEEYRGAVGQDNITGWRSKRDAVRDELELQGVCLGDSGFFLCPAAMGD